MSNDKSEILIEDLPRTVQEYLRAELVAVHKDVVATNLRVQESVNRYLSPAVIPALVQTREEGVDDEIQSLSGATWVLVRFNKGIQDLVDFFAPGDYTIATSDPDEPGKLVTYSVRRGFDVVVGRDQVEIVPVASLPSRNKHDLDLRCA